MSVHITYFVHGTTTDNEKGLSTGHNPGRLSTLGVSQCKTLGNILKNNIFDAIFCSDLKRAVDSTKLIFKKNDFISDKRLREVNYGILNGHPEAEIIYKNHINTKFPNGESMKDVEKRISSFIIFLKEKYNNKHVALVAHKAPQLAFEVLLNKKTWLKAIATDWRNTKNWKPGWDYFVN